MFVQGRVGLGVGSGVGVGVGVGEAVALPPLQPTIRDEVSASATSSRLVFIGRILASPLQLVGAGRGGTTDPWIP